MRFLIGFFLFVLISLCYGCNDEVPVKTNARYKLGDSIVWRLDSYDDKKWTKGNGINGKAIFWLRFRLENKEVVKPLGVKVIALGAYQLYLNGELLGESGRVGDVEQEIAGNHVNYFLIPDSLAKPGLMLFALRASNFNAKTHFSFFNIKVGPYRELVEYPLRNALIICILAGCFLIGVIYYIFLYFNNPNEKQFMFFALICLLFFLLMSAEYLPRFLEYPYPAQTQRLQLIGWLTFAISLTIPIFLNREFKVVKVGWLFAILIGVLLFIHFNWLGRYDLSAQLMSLSMWIISLILTLVASLKRQEGALVVLAGIILSGLIGLFLYYDYSLFLSFGMVIISMLYLLSARSKKINLAYNDALLVSERLKTELLKKTIQPHFIMNTLTSLIDWIEESPEKGIGFIHALALEFEVLAKMTDLTVVPIGQEIQLCKTHLRVMAYRKEIDYVWSDTNIDLTEHIPPAIFHTLVENGISHSLAKPDGKIEFNLAFKIEEQGKIYALTTLAKNRKVDKTKKGTGLAYVEARLTESYGNKWELISEPTVDGWQTLIKLTK